MGRLTHNDRWQELSVRTLVGRDQKSDLHLPSTRVSSRQARVWWEEDVWKICDLGSRNGTWVEGRRVTEEPMELRPGVRIAFGDPDEIWTLSEAGPPRLMAVSEQGQRVGDPTLHIPSDTDRQATVHRMGTKVVLETETGIEAITDGHVFFLGDVLWTVRIPPRAVERWVDDDPTLDESLFADV